MCSISVGDSNIYFVPRSCHFDQLPKVSITFLIMFVILGLGFDNLSQMIKSDIIMTKLKFHMRLKLTFIADSPGCPSVLKVAVNDVFIQKKLSAEFTVTFCPRVEIFSSNGQSGQYTPSQQNW